jgi:5-methylcytosine-specific restriction endonuclease McrA
MHKTCLICGQPSRTNRCPRHSTQPIGRNRSWVDELARRRIVASATHCWICGQPARPGDPLTADHVIPRSRGGPDVPGNYRAAHRSCNSRRGNNPSRIG